MPTYSFHVVLTLPQSLRDVTSLNPRAVYGLLFQAGVGSLLRLGHDPEWLGGQMGITAVLHTWTRELKLHPHLHCLVTGGGLSHDGNRWLSFPDNFLFPVKVLGKLFRGKFLDGLKTLLKTGELRLPEVLNHPTLYEDWLNTLYKTDWVTYVKRPFDGPARVLQYLGQYTHRVGLSNRRLQHFDGQNVTFVTRGEQTATLPVETFVRRFLTHVLPSGFTRLRHYGLYAPAHVKGRLERSRALLSQANALTPALAEPPPRVEKPPPPSETPTSPAEQQSDENRCPLCCIPLLCMEILPLPPVLTSALTDDERALWQALSSRAPP